MIKNYLFKTIILVSCFLFFSSKSKAQCTYATSQSISAATFLGCGSITINAGVTLTVTGGLTNNTGGLNITVVDNGSLVINSGITLNSNGNLSVSGTGSMSVTSGGLTINNSGGFTNGVNTTIAGGITGGGSGNISNTGTLSVTGGNITLNSTGGLSNTGVVSVAGSVTIANSGAITNSGSFSVTNNVTQNSSGGFIDNGTLTVGGFYSIQNSGGLSGSGSATVTGTASTTSTGNFFGSSTTCTGCTLSNAGEMLSSCDFKFRRLITINSSQVSGGVNLTNFPMLVNIASDATLKSAANGGHVQSANGYDIMFTASDGATNLNFQLETYVATTGQYVAWVNIPTLSATANTYIYMYYGDASVTTNQSSTSTWSSNYSGVWHLDESPTASAPQYKDVTVNAENCTAGGSMVAANQVAGQIYNAASLNGTSNYMYTTAASLPKNNATQTISFWEYYATSPGGAEEVQVIIQNQPSSSSQCLGFLSGAAQNWLWGGGAEVSSGAIPSAAAWHYISYTYNGTTNSYYVDGVLKASTATAPNTVSPNYMVLGSWFSGGTTPGGNYFNGILDEVHVCNVANSAGWVATEYNNQSSPGTFYTIAGEPNTWTGGTNTAWGTNANWSSGIAPVAGVDVIISNGTNQPTLAANIQVNSIYINNTATLSLAANNLSVYGNITTCGTFQGGTGTLVLDGTNAQVQTISGSGTYTIYDLTVNNTSTANPSVKLQQSVTVNDVYTHTTGTLDLNGLGLTISSPAAAAASNFNAGTIMTSVAGGAITVTDNNTKVRMNFEGTNFGDATNGVAINCTSSDSYFEGGTFYGTVNFTKTGGSTNVCKGGCTFYGPCTFNTSAGSDRWKFGNIKSDIFYNATFNHLCTGGGNNFIVAYGSLGNQFYGTTTIFSQSPGGFYVGRDNAASNATSDFHGPVLITVAQTGTVFFAESNGSYQHVTTFEDVVQINSASGSTGNVQIGTSAQSTVTVTNTGRFTAGSVLGATDVYLTNVTQTGTTYVQTVVSNAASASTLHLGTVAPCSFAGSTSFTFPAIQIANNTFNGTNNLFVFTGSTNSITQNGNNTFAASTNTTFSNTGTGDFKLGVAAVGADAFNGNVIFIQTSSGLMSPAFSTNSTFGGNISTVGTSSVITFGGTGAGTVTINGTSAQTFTGSASKTPIVQNLTMNGSGGLTLAVPVQIAAGGNLVMTNGLITTSATNVLELLDETNTTTTGSATSYVNGPLKYDVTSNVTQTLNFPIGKSPDWRPAVLTINHANNTQYNYTAELFDANPWAAFSSTWPGDMPTATVDTISGVHYWTIARTDGSGNPASSTNLNYSAGVYPLIQLNFGTNDQVYQGANLTIVKNTSATPNTWIDIGGTSALGNFSTPQAGNVTSTSLPTAFNSFSSFSLGSRNTGWNPLPIELLSFSAIANGSKVDLKWETITETNNAYFTIEKSKDGENFTKVMDVPGAGNSTSYREYLDADYQPYEGTSYYRLKQTDKNGAYKYFTIVPVEFAIDGQVNITMFPNPISNTNALNVEVTGYKNEQVLVLLRDMQGKECLRKVVLSNNDDQVFIVDETKQLTPGTYIITATSYNKIYNYKVIVK